MKYPLATVKRLCDEYGYDICLGYDIMCAFWMTLSKSSLAAQTVAFCLHGVVPTFHGHVHNQGFQVKWRSLHSPPLFQLDSSQTLLDLTYPECQIFGSGVAGIVQ